MVKGGVEDSHLRRGLAEQFARCQNALDVIGIVQRRKFNAVFNPLQHLIVDQR